MAAVVGLSQTAPQPDAARQTALALERQGKNAEAETAWRAVLKAHPSSPESYGHLGLLEARQEHYKEAIPLYRKALRMNPNVPGLRLNLGLALFKSGDLKAKFRGTARTEQQNGDIYLIHEKDVRRFILEHPTEIDLRKVDQLWFLDVLTNGFVCSA